MTDWLLDAVLGLLLLSLAGGALHVRQLYAGVLLFIAFGLVLALVWARLGAADLALAEAAIGAGLTGVLLFAALARQPRAGSEPQLSRRRRLAAVAVVLPLLLMVLPQLAPLAELQPSVPTQIDAALAQSGVEHPVTAVLLNFRAWDTLLELAVLLLALLGARQLGSLQPQLSEPWPMLRAWGRTLAPLLVLAAASPSPPPSCWPPASSCCVWPVRCRRCAGASGRSVCWCWSACCCSSRWRQPAPGLAMAGCSTRPAGPSRLSSSSRPRRHCPSPRA